jgi:hypothetical protein
LLLPALLRSPHIAAEPQPNTTGDDVPPTSETLDDKDKDDDDDAHLTETEGGAATNRGQWLMFANIRTSLEKHVVTIRNHLDEKGL